MTQRDAIDGREAIVAPDDERDALAALDQALRAREGDALSLTLPDGAPIALPATAAELLRRAVNELARGRALTVLSLGRDLTTQQAADLLNVSRPFLIQLLDKSELPHHMVGTHRRIPLDALLAYRRGWDERRDQALNELVQFSEELGMYDMPKSAAMTTTH